MALALKLLLIAGLCLAPFGATVSAEEVRSGVRAVVELFTSQGCASCPAADALLSELDGQEDVVALAYHVDYWDYIGWPDTYGHADNSQRQRAYAAGWGSSRIFTPQMVINGAVPVVGSKEEDVMGALAGAALPLGVELRREGDALEIVVPAAPGEENAMIWLVSFIDAAEVAIERGENAGEQFVYTQIVTHRAPLGLWQANEGVRIQMPLNEAMPGASNGVAVLVQTEAAGLPGPVLGAALYLR